jgi:hypothetical protein
LAERRAKEAEQKAEEIKFDEDLIPDPVFEKTEIDIEMDRVIDQIGLVDAYNRWCGKMRPVVRGEQREGIKISCPIPGHLDKNPSAWLNLDKQTWYCGGCQEGGDKYDIAAWHFGFSVPGYKDGADFHRLREDMAKDFGFVITRLAGGTVSITAPVIEPEEPDYGPRPDAPSADVVLLRDDPDEDEPIDVPSLDWRKICPEETFLDRYMRATVIDDVPEEYHFIHGLIALGFALGRDAALFDSVPVYGNLFVCTLGRSGTGKSKARRHLDNLLQAALPHDRSAPISRGVLRVNAPGSAESLINSFMNPEEDPTNPKRIIGYKPVRGLIDFNELSALVGRTNRQGSVIKPTLMQFYDMENIVSTHSMTTGLKIAEKPFASALTTSQPRALRGLIDAADDASGFLNRWLFIPGKEKRRYSVGGVTVDVAPAVKPLQEIQTWAVTTFGPGEYVEWSTGALKLFDEFFHNVLEPERKRARNDLLVRIDLTLKKFILLFAANRFERVVSEQSVADALFCYQYLKAAYGIPEAQIGNTLNNEMSEAVLEKCKQITEKTGKGATLREIDRGLAKRKYDKKKLADMIDTLVKLDLIEVVTTKTGQVGRPTKRFKYVG